MRALDLKLLRDFRRLWAQALAIALVLGCGVAIFLTSFGMYRALDATRDAYYERNRFADVFAQARRAPLSLMREIEALPGVLGAEARVQGNVILDIPGRAETAMGRVISLPATGLPRLNVPILRSGRLPDPEAKDEIAVNEPFARANGFVEGDVISANLDGQKRRLTITGTFLSPEFIYTLGPGALMPDNEGFGLLWMPQNAAAAAFDMTGAFNSVSLNLTAGADIQEVMDRLDVLLEPYGGTGAYDRSRQESDAFISAEITQLKSMAMILPPVFFGISAFLVNMVLGRIVALERSEIGLLKAIGYSNGEIALHYILLAGLVAVGGVVLGWLVGGWLAHQLALLYADFFDFPYLIFRLTYDTYAISALIGLATAGAGAAGSAMRAARLDPAVAMAPPTPPRFRRSILDRFIALTKPSQPTVMIIRSISRWPVRSGLTALGLALALAVLVAASFFNDALDEIIDTAFYQSNRQDGMLLFANDMPLATLEDVRALPGVLAVEGQQYMDAMLHHGHLSKHIAIEARAPQPDMSRVIDGNGNPIDAPENGILLSKRLAEQLDAQVGDVIEVAFMAGRRESTEVPVAGIVVQYFGIGAYMDLQALNRLHRQSTRVSVANVLLDDAKIPDLHAQLKETPNLVGMIMLNETRRSFQDTIAKNVVIMNTIYITIAVLITIGVAYNSARIQLSERARELASLRILGFTNAEVSYILVGETMILALLAQPLGWLIGAGLATAMAKSSASDLYSIPLVLKASTFSLASLVVLFAALGAALIVRRRLDRLDLVAVMKTRE